MTSFFNSKWQKLLSQIFDIIQSDIVLYLQVH